MSQSESPLRTVIANIPAHAIPALPRLAALADHAFTLAIQQAGCDPNNVPSGNYTKGRQARILYSVKDRVGLPLPVKVVLYQDVPAMQIQRVVVNFQTGAMQCEGQPSLPIKILQIERVRNEIELYLRNLLESPASHKVHCSAWQDFLKRLESNGISPAQSQDCTGHPFSEKPCPSCEVLTVPCTSCRAVICLSWDCPASRLTPFQSCSRHTYFATCLPCLQNARTIPPLGQCPECNIWFCSDELTWCMGRPKETPNQTPSNTMSSSVREHPPKPILCSYCDLDQAGSECSNATCWSKKGKVKRPRICQSCSPAGGISCACEGDWICDSCKELPTVDCLKQCPQCKRAYCDSECEYIRFCAECDRPTLCDDCGEEDWGSFAGLDGPEVQAREVKLVGACQADSCLSKFCRECPKSEELKCVECNVIYCCDCTDLYLRYEQCNSCDHSSYSCEECAEGRQRCVGCDETYCSLCMWSELCNSCDREFERQLPLMECCDDELYYVF